MSSFQSTNITKYSVYNINQCHERQYQTAGTGLSALSKEAGDDCRDLCMCHGHGVPTGESPGSRRAPMTVWQDYYDHHHC